MVNGERATIVIELHNAGDSAAFNVRVKDAAWDAQYFKADASDLKVDFERIGGGQTVRHEYEVTPTSAVQGWVMPATVVYEATSEPGSQQTLSSTQLVFMVYSTTHRFWRTVLHIGRFASFGHFTTLSHWKNFGIVAGVALAVAGSLLGYREVTESRRRHKYNKALEAVRNMK
ncbi:hypothetical protein WJX81_002069 [Elliptochloris bilobata]|uniref:Translocon-associated protein subunit beta n=1 Tax=Elliptochloris bilobata TaxID=381761 RepID=A0AAW1QV25_9CHLO